MFDKKNIEDIRPLNQTQNSILISNIKSSEKQSYIHHFCFDIIGFFDVERFQKAYACLLKKYSALRSIVLYNNVQKPVQIVMKTREEKMVCVRTEETALEETSKKLIASENEKLNKLESVFLFDISIIMSDLEDGKTHIIFSFHHIILDGWSLGLIVSELFNIYHSMGKEVYKSEKELFDFKDYLHWKKKNEIEEVSGAIQEMLADQINAVGIPTQFCDEKSFKEGNCSCILEEETYKEIEMFCRKHELTSNAFFLGTWAVLLAKYNRTEEVSFGTVLSGRNGKIAAIEDAVGNFIQTVPIVLDVNEQKNTLDIMKKVNELSFDYMQNQSSVDYACEKGSSAYDHVVAFENYPIADLLVSQNDRFGIEIVNIRYFGYTNFDFGFTMTPIAGRTIELLFKYNVNSYTEDYMEEVLSCYCHLLRTFVKGNVPIDKIALTDQEAQQKAFLCDLNWNNTETVVSRFFNVVEKCSSKNAIFDINSVFTYEELDQKSNAIAHYLHEKGIRNGDVIAVLAERRAEFIIGMLGVLKTGAAYLPLNADFAKGRMYQYMEAAKVQIVLAQDMRCADMIQ